MSCLLNVEMQMPSLVLISSVGDKLEALQLCVTDCSNLYAGGDVSIPS